MINHFNAFISYKHADLDNKVAASIVKDLEHFHIPGKIRKSTGVKKIDRIFRDKDELPITNDLNDTISQALYNSDFLIVICSTNTHKSTWVEKEIETFLKNHTINQILTVLADGEPYEVIPKVLLTGKREVVNDKGETITEEFPYEPLSCDYRMPYRRAKAEELPRLAAAIIGCAYDELINRQRQYKMHRMAAVFAGAMALSLGFAGYMLYSNTQIQKNYVESLRNQSKYLANESSKQLSDENRMGAMQLALAALPADEEDVRPETPEAVRALANATLAYVSPQTSNVSAVWNYRMPNKIKNFKVFDDGSRLAAIDHNNVVSVWDTETHAELVSVNDPEDNCRFYEFFDADTFVVVKGKSVSAYDLKTGREIWNNNGNLNFIMIDKAFKFSEDSILLVCGNGYLYELDIRDGSVRNEYVLFSEDESNIFTLGESSLSDDSTRLAISITDRSDYSNVLCSIAEYDFRTKELKTSPVDAEFIGNICYQGDNIYYSCPEGNLDGSVRMFDYNYITQDHTAIYCLSSGDLTLKWQDECINSDLIIKYGFFPMETGVVAYYAGNSCKIWDNETGEVISDLRINDSIIDISDRDKDGEPLFITDAGGSASPATMGETTGVQSIKRFSEDLVDAEVAKGIYTLKYQSREIIYYGTAVYDKDWTRVDGSRQFDLSYNVKYMDEGVLAVLAPEDDGTILRITDPSGKKYIGDIMISDQIAPSYFTVLGSYAQKLYMVSFQSHKFSLITVDIGSMQMTEEVIDEEYFAASPVCALDGKELAYMVSDGTDSCMLNIRNLDDGSEKSIALPYVRCSSMAYSADAGFAYVYGGSESDMFIDISKEEGYPVPLTEGWEYTQNAVFDTDGTTYALTNLSKIRLMSTEGDLISEIPCENVEPQGLFFLNKEGSGKELIVPYANGGLTRYSAGTGEFIGKSELSVYSVTSASSDIKYDEETGNLYVTNGMLLDVVDTDSWLETISIDGCYGYHKGEDVFFTYGYTTSRQEGEIGYFKHYSTNELILKAKELLQGLEMTEEEKSIYGIG